MLSAHPELPSQPKSSPTPGDRGDKDNGQPGKIRTHQQGVGTLGMGRICLSGSRLGACEPTGECPRVTAKPCSRSRAALSDSEHFLLSGKVRSIATEAKKRKEKIYRLVVGVGAYLSAKLGVGSCSAQEESAAGSQGHLLAP